MSISEIHLGIHPLGEIAADRTNQHEKLASSIDKTYGLTSIYEADDDNDNDSDPWDRIGDELVEEPLVVCTETIHDALSFEPKEDSVQNEALVELIFLEIGIELNKGRRSEYELGKLLHRLQRERAKPGSGTFLKDVEIICHEWTISRATIYRRINFFNAINRDLAELEDVRLSHSDKEAWPGEWEADDVDAEEKDAADALAVAQKKVIEEAARRVAAKKAENSQRDPAKTIKLLGLSSRARKAVHLGFVKLEDVAGRHGS